MHLHRGAAIVNQTAAESHGDEDRKEISLGEFQSVSEFTDANLVTITSASHLCSMSHEVKREIYRRYVDIFRVSPKVNIYLGNIQVLDRKEMLVWVTILVSLSSNDEFLFYFFFQYKKFWQRFVTYDTYESNFSTWLEIFTNFFLNFAKESQKEGSLSTSPFEISPKSTQIIFVHHRLWKKLSIFVNNTPPLSTCLRGKSHDTRRDEKLEISSNKRTSPCWATIKTR